LESGDGAFRAAAIHPPTMLREKLAPPLPGTEGGVTHPELPKEIAEEGEVLVGLPHWHRQSVFPGISTASWGRSFIKDRRIRHLVLVLNRRRSLGETSE
jgi:hypothetical protein